MSYMCVRWLPHGNGEEVIRVRPHWPVRALQLVVGLHVVSMIEREVNRGASAERNGGKLQIGSPAVLINPGFLDFIKSMIHLDFSSC